MPDATPFQKEAWTEYGLGVIILFLRIFARTKAVGVRNWEGDDYFTILALLFWTLELCMLELIGQYGTNIGLSDHERASLTDAEHAKLVFGSKCLLAGWCCYTTLIWCLKTCMLFFYHRITLGLFQQKLVKIAAVACALTYVTVMITILAHCRPFPKNWQVYPDPGDSCTLDVENYIAIVVTNLTTDAILVCIPMPLLVKVKIPLYRKLLISLLLCSGVFVMVATLLRCILSLKDVTGIDNSTIWAIRETFVGLICVNAPCIKPLFSSSAWNPGPNNSYSKTPFPADHAATVDDCGIPTYHDSLKTAHNYLVDPNDDAAVRISRDVISIRASSEEPTLLNRPSADDPAYGYSNTVYAGDTTCPAGSGGVPELGIQVTTTWTTSSERRDSSI